MLAVSLFWLGVGLVAVAMLILFIDSFKHRKVWSLISLILIVPLLIHMVMNWSKLNVRKAFYIMILGALTIVVSIVGGALAQLPFLADHEVVQVLEENIAPQKVEPLPNQEKADAAALAVEENYDPLLTGSEYETLDAKEIVPEDVDKVNPGTVPSARYEVVSEDQRAQAINKWIRLTLIDGKIVEGRLTNVVDEAVLVESSVDGGSLGLSYSDDQIKTMAVRLEAGEQLLSPESNDAESLAEGTPQDILPDAQSDLTTIRETVDVIEQSSETIEAGDVATPNMEILDQPAPEEPVTETLHQVDEVEVEVIKPEMKVVQEQTVTEQPATEVLQQVEEMVDDSKSVDSPIGQ